MPVATNGHVNGNNTSNSTASTKAVPVNGKINGGTGVTGSKAGLDLNNDRAEELIRMMTDGLVNIVDKSGEFLLKCECISPQYVVLLLPWGRCSWAAGQRQGAGQAWRLDLVDAAYGKVMRMDRTLKLIYSGRWFGG
jgi:hypothetical protein